MDALTLMIRTVEETEPTGDPARDEERLRGLLDLRAAIERQLAHFEHAADELAD